MAISERLSLNKCLALAGLFYLLCEFAFNAALIHAVSSINAGYLEQIARLLAGVGLALLLVRLRLRDSKPWLIGLLALGLIVGYVAQKTVLDGLEHAVSEKDRISAPDIALLETGLLSGAINVHGLSPKIRNDRESYTSFIAMLGYSAWHNDQMLKIIHEQRGHIREQIALINFKSALPEQYGQYRKAMAKARQAFASEVSKDQAANQKIARAAGQYSGILNWFLEHRTACQSDACRKRYDDEYNQRVVRALGYKIPWQAFCTQKGTRQVFTTSNGQIVSQMVNGGWDCSQVNPAIIVGRLKVALAKRQGQPVGNFESFLKRPEVQGRIAHLFPDLHGLSIQPGWSEAEFAEAVGRQIRSGAITAPVITPAMRQTAARAVLVPPVAIGFSLLFVLLNVLTYANEGLARATRWPTYYRVAGLAIVALAFALMSPANGVIGGASGWLVDVAIHYENLIYPIGHFLLEIF